MTYEESVRQLEYIQRLEERSRRLLWLVGKLKGGLASNVAWEAADALIDLTEADAPRCDCTGPPMQPCGPSCLYPYTDGADAPEEYPPIPCRHGVVGGCKRDDA